MQQKIPRTRAMALTLNQHTLAVATKFVAIVDSRFSILLSRPKLSF